MSVTIECCSVERPHATIEAMPHDGKTHFVSTIVNTSLAVSPQMAAMHPAWKGRVSAEPAPLVEPGSAADLRRQLDERDADDLTRSIEGRTDYDYEQRIAGLEAKIAAALEALRIPHPEQPYNAWVNSGNGWTRKAHDARLALGAEQ